MEASEERIFFFIYCSTVSHDIRIDQNVGRWCWFEWTHSNWSARASLNCQSSWAEQYTRRNGKKMLFTLHTTIVQHNFSGAAPQTQHIHKHKPTIERRTMLATTTSTTEAETLSSLFIYARVFVCQSEKSNVFWWTFSVLIWLSSNVGYAIVLNSRQSHVVAYEMCGTCKHAPQTQNYRHNKCYVFLFYRWFSLLLLLLFSM